MVAARISYYCLNIPVLIIKEKHGLVWNPSFPLDLLEMLGLVSPAGEYFLHKVTVCEQYRISMRFLKPKKCLLREELSKNTRVCGMGTIKSTQGIIREWQIEKREIQACSMGVPRALLPWALGVSWGRVYWSGPRFLSFFFCDWIISS